MEVLELELDELFARAAAVSDERTASVRAQADTELSGLDDVDQTQLDKSLRLKVALDDLRATHRADAFALRCWPETFTEYGAAVCGPAAMLGNAQVPCACEADVYGALSQLLLQQTADAAVFLADIVDVDAADNSVVLWHCGQAPVSLGRSWLPADSDDSYQPAHAVVVRICAQARRGYAVAYQPKPRGSDAGTSPRHGVTAATGVYWYIRGGAL